MATSRTLDCTTELLAICPYQPGLQLVNVKWLHFWSFGGEGKEITSQGMVSLGNSPIKTSGRGLRVWGGIWITSS